MTVPIPTDLSDDDDDRADDDDSTIDLTYPPFGDGEYDDDRR